MYLLIVQNFSYYVHTALLGKKVNIFRKVNNESYTE